jgi:thioredoxin 1
VDRKKLILKIGVPALIVLIIAGIFAFKSWNKDDATVPNSTDTIPLAVQSVDLEKLKEHKQPIVIDFGADSCIPCKEMAPVLKKLNEEWQGKAVVQFVDVWKYGEAAQDFPIQVIPTQVFYTADGKPFTPSEELSAEIEFTMYSHKETGDHLFTVHQGGLTEAQMRKIFVEMGVE